MIVVIRRGTTLGMSQAMETNTILQVYVVAKLGSRDTSCCTAGLRMQCHVQMAGDSKSSLLSYVLRPKLYHHLLGGSVSMNWRLLLNLRYDIQALSGSRKGRPLYYQLDIDLQVDELIKKLLFIRPHLKSPTI